MIKYSRPQLTTTYDVKTLIASASGMGSVFQCFEEPDPVCGRPQP